MEKSTLQKYNPDCLGLLMIKLILLNGLSQDKIQAEDILLQVNDLNVIFFTRFEALMNNNVEQTINV